MFCDSGSARGGRRDAHVRRLDDAAEPEWTNTQVIDGNVPAAITRLKHATLADITALSDGTVMLSYQTDTPLAYGG